MSIVNRVWVVLCQRGYEPFREDGGDVVRLRNCPFHAVGQRHPEMVCDMNLSLLGGHRGVAVGTI
jgi:predicted ArsR family transcriptional regulator